MGGMKRGSRLTIGLALLATVLLPVLYVLSFGPMYWLFQHGYLDGPVFGLIYFPMIELAERHDHVGRIVEAYAFWWSPP